MSRNRISTAFFGLVLVLGITGCERDPRDIAKWKADGNTGKLIAATADHRQFVRIDAIDALAELQAEEAIDPLAALFSDPDLVIVHKAIDAVASMEDPRVEKHMLNALGIKTAPARTTAAMKLGTLKSEAAVDPLIALLDEKDEAVVVAAATALGQIGNPKAINPLGEKVNERSFNIRMASVTSLGQIGGTEAAGGLEPAMGSISTKVRNAVIESLIGIGPASTPIALNALRSGNHYKRESGIAVLQGLNNVPTNGSEMVWYRLANLTSGENPAVDPTRDTGIAYIDNMEVLLEALAHEQRIVRDYALLALTALGESAAAPALTAAEQDAGEEAKTWLNGRSRWSGAPSWQIDLWAAATALNPGFRINNRILTDLEPHTHSAEQIMKSGRFKPRREYIPLLIDQLATYSTEVSSGESQLTLFGIDIKTQDSANGSEKISVQRAKRCRRLAEQHLINADYEAVLPLRAALEDDDHSTAALSAGILFKIEPEQAEESVAAAFKSRMDKGEPLSDTPLYTAMQSTDRAAIQALLLKVRPNERQAIKTAERKYPGVQFSSIPLGVEIDPRLKAAPFKLVYSDGRRDKVLKVVFRPNENNDWVPNPPLSDKLP